MNPATIFLVSLFSFPSFESFAALFYFSWLDLFLETEVMESVRKCWSFDNDKKEVPRNGSFVQCKPVEEYYQVHVTTTLIFAKILLLKSSMMWIPCLNQLKIFIVSSTLRDRKFFHVFFKYHCLLRSSVHWKCIGINLWWKMNHTFEAQVWTKVERLTT